MIRIATMAATLGALTITIGCAVKASEKHASASKGTTVAATFATTPAIILTPAPTPLYAATQPAAADWSIEKAIAAALEAPGFAGFRHARGYVQIPSGRHVVSRPVDLRAAYQLAVVAEPGAVIVAGFDDGSLPIFDMTGAVGLQFWNVTVDAGGRKVGAAWFAARRDAPGGPSAGFHTWTNCRAEGAYSVAPMVWAASECNTINACQFYNCGGGACFFAGTWCPGISIPHAKQTMLQGSLYDCFLGGQAASETGLIKLFSDGTIVADLLFFGGGGSTLAETAAIVDVEVTPNGGQVDGIHFWGGRFETEHAKSAVRFRSKAAPGWGPRCWLFGGGSWEANGPFLLAPGVYPSQMSIMGARVKPTGEYSRAATRPAAITAGEAIDGFPITNWGYNALKAATN